MSGHCYWDFLSMFFRTEQTSLRYQNQQEKNMNDIYFIRPNTNSDKVVLEKVLDIVNNSSKLLFCISYFTHMTIAEAIIRRILPFHFAGKMFQPVCNNYIGKPEPEIISNHLVENPVINLYRRCFAFYNQYRVT